MNSSTAQPSQRLGEILIRRGLITPGQLELALQEQRHSREFLGMILTRMEFIQPRVLLATLSEQFKIPHEELPVERVDWSAAKQFPQSILAGINGFPVRADGESVTVAIANPLDAWGLSVIENAAGFRKVKPVLVLESELAAVKRAFTASSWRTIADKLNSDGPS